MKAFRWRSLVALIVAIVLLLSAWLSLDQINGVVNADVDHSIQEIVAWLMTLAATLLLLLAFLSLFMRRSWLAGLRLVIGIWLVVSSWILSQAMGTILTLILIAGGIAVVTVAAFDLYRDIRHEAEELSHMS